MSPVAFYISTLIFNSMKHYKIYKKHTNDKQCNLYHVLWCYLNSCDMQHLITINCTLYPTERLYKTVLNLFRHVLLFKLNTMSFQKVLNLVKKDENSVTFYTIRSTNI